MVKEEMIEHITQRMSEWDHLGVKSISSGSRLVAHTPRDYPEAYLHSYFAPSEKTAWQTYDFQLSPQLSQLYEECNGLSIFASALSIYGLRSHSSRDLSAQFQPFDLAKHHSECIHTFHGKQSTGVEERIFFGSYGRDGSHLFTTQEDLRVHRVLRGSCEIVNTWTDISSFLTAEYDRLDSLFSRAGYLVSKDTVTNPTPIKTET